MQGRLRRLDSRYSVARTSAETALDHLRKTFYELIVICHTVPLAEAAMIIRAAAEIHPTIRISWLADWQTPSVTKNKSAKVMSIDHVAPNWLRVVNAVADEIVAQRQAMHRSRPA
jgi:hypothetical protein